MSKDATGILTQEHPFVGQGTANLYTRSGDAEPYSYTPVTTGQAVTGTIYYYTLDGGNTYLKATCIAYADFENAVLYTDPAHTIAKTETTPGSGPYYDATGAYCVILPQQVNGWYRYQYTPAEKYACLENEKALAGATYFDKYYQNNGVYYTKVIKVQ